MLDAAVVGGKSENEGLKTQFQGLKSQLVTLQNNYHALLQDKEQLEADYLELQESMQLSQRQRDEVDVEADRV